MSVDHPPQTDTGRPGISTPDCPPAGYISNSNQPSDFSSPPRPRTPSENHHSPNLTTPPGAPASAGPSYTSPLQRIQEHLNALTTRQTETIHAHVTDILPSLVSREVGMLVGQITNQVSAMRDE